MTLSSPITHSNWGTALSKVPRTSDAMGGIGVISAAGLAAFLIAGCGSGGTATGVEAQKALTPRLVSVSPAAGSRNVNGAKQITVTYSHRLTAAAELPRLHPPLAATWQRNRGE